VSLKRVLLIVGPTAVGKTAVSINLAKHLDCEIISADSRQVYKFMSIGTAKPTEKERAAVPHHFIDIKYPDEYYSAGQFGEEARACIEDVFARGKQPVVVGGSGLYIRALVNGFFGEQIADGVIKQSLKRELKELGLPALYLRLRKVDPVMAARLPETDAQRILRALEVYEITLKPFSSFLEKDSSPADFAPHFVGLNLDRAQLYDRINRRVDLMIEAGLVEEVRNLLKRGYGPGLNALRTVGYQEVIAHFDGALSYPDMVALIKQKSRNYAKRQITWFRKESRVRWHDIHPNLAHEILTEFSPETA